MTSDDDVPEHVTEAAREAQRADYEQKLEGYVLAVGALQKRLDIRQLIFTLQSNGDVAVARFDSGGEQIIVWRLIDRVSGNLIDPDSGEVRIEGFSTPRDK